MTLRLFLLQARYANDPMREHELRCFADRCGVTRERIEPWDLLQGPPSKRRLQECDTLLIGGSGDFYISKGNLPHVDAFLEMLQEVTIKEKPCFASCFGYQAFVQAMGGTIVFDPDRTEVGTYRLTLSEHGQKDPLFNALPQRFNAQMGHKDRATAHPDGFANLASSERSPFQAFRVAEAPIWGTQFHPELTRATNVERFQRYLEGYAPYMSQSEREEQLKGFQESRHTEDLLRRFLTLVFG